MKENKLVIIFKFLCIILLISFSFTLTKEFIDIPNNNNKNNRKNAGIKIGIVREPINGLNEELLKNFEVIEILKKSIVANVKLRSEEAFYSQGGSGQFEVKFDSEAWSVSVENKNFVIVEINARNITQLKNIIGIQDNKLVRIFGARNGNLPVPHSYGPLADKMKNVFGVSFSNE
jgi:hypothetical protein